MNWRLLTDEAYALHGRLVSAWWRERDEDRRLRLVRLQVRAAYRLRRRQQGGAS